MYLYCLSGWCIIGEKRPDHLSCSFYFLSSIEIFSDSLSCEIVLQNIKQNPQVFLIHSGGELAIAEILSARISQILEMPWLLPLWFFFSHNTRSVSVLLLFFCLKRKFRSNFQKQTLQFFKLRYRSEITSQEFTPYVCVSLCIHEMARVALYV